MVSVKWVKIFLDDAIEDGYNISKKLYYQIGSIVEEMGQIDKIEIDNSQITIYCKPSANSNEHNLIVIPINSNILKYHCGESVKSIKHHY